MQGKLSVRFVEGICALLSSPMIKSILEERNVISSLQKRDLI